MMFWSGTVEEAIPTVAGLGFDVIEIWAEHLWRGDETPSRVRQALERERLLCTVHCPIMDVNITSPNRGIRAESLRQNLAAVDLAADLGARLLVTHPGQLFSRHDSLNEYWDIQLAAFEQIVALAQRRSVRVAVENMDLQSVIEVVKSAGEVRRITGHFGPDELGIVLDTTHLNTTDRILDFVAQSEDIVHTHLSDAAPLSADKVRTHLALGDGALDFARLLAALLPKYTGILSLETFIPAGNPDKIRSQRQWLSALVESLHDVPAPTGSFL